MVLVWDALYVGLAARGLAARGLKTPSRKQSQAVQVLSHVMPQLTVLLTGAAAMSLQGSFETADQGRSSKRLGQEANSARLQCTGADALFGKGRDKDKRRSVPLGPHMDQKVQAAHSGHLHIRNDA